MPGSEHIGVGLVDPAHLPRVWPTVRHWLERALEHHAGPAPAQSIRAMRARVQRRRYGLMIATHGERILGAAVLEVGELRGERLLNIIAAGGESGKALELVAPAIWQTVQDVAQILGADRVRVAGRRGWLRWFRKMRGQVREVVIYFPVKKEGAACPAL